MWPLPSCGMCFKSDIGDLVQLIPCLHVFCTGCIVCHKLSSKVCPVLHCYSPLKLATDIKWNPCESETCNRRLSPAGEIFRLACDHNICAQCYDECAKKESAVCCVAECGVALNEDEEREPCDACKTPFDQDKLSTTSCCQARMCRPCYDKLTGGKGACPAGKCVVKSGEGGGGGGGKKKKGKGDKPAAANPCAGGPECEGEVLRNFPSEQECEHEVCLGCLGRVIEECELTSSAPLCPNDACRVPYRFESVSSLKALFPEKASYFATFDLEYHHGFEALKDDTATKIDIVADFKSSLRRTEIKVCVCEDEENTCVVEFDRYGSLGDFIREARRVLKVMPTDKVYGYFRKDDGEEELLTVNTKTINKTLVELKITPETVVMIDNTGIVNQKKQDKPTEKDKGKDKGKKTSNEKLESRKETKKADDKKK